jgi:hypothetical protein
MARLIHEARPLTVKQYCHCNWIDYPYEGDDEVILACIGTLQAYEEATKEEAPPSPPSPDPA